MAYYRILSFIVTLAGMLVFKGLTLWLLAGQSVGAFPTKFQRISEGFLPDPDAFDMEGMNLMSVLIGLAVAALATRNRAAQARTGAADAPFAFFDAKTAFVFFGIVWMSWLRADFRGLPNVFMVMAVLIAIYSLVTGRSTVRRRIYAIAGNEKAVTLSGINSKRLVFPTFANMGARRARGPRLRRAAEHRDPKGGRHLRARRDRGPLHRRRLDGWRRRHGGGGRGGGPPKLLRRGATDMVRISDARMSGTAYGTVVLHAAPEAATGGPLAVLRGDDVIELDVEARRLHLDIPGTAPAGPSCGGAADDPGPRGRPREALPGSRGGADTGADLDILRGCRGRQVPRVSRWPRRRIGRGRGPERYPEDGTRLLIVLPRERSGPGSGTGEGREPRAVAWPARVMQTGRNWECGIS